MTLASFQPTIIIPIYRLEIFSCYCLILARKEFRIWSVPFEKCTVSLTVLCQISLFGFSRPPLHAAWCPGTLTRVNHTMALPSGFQVGSASGDPRGDQKGQENRIPTDPCVLVLGGPRHQCFSLGGPFSSPLLLGSGCSVYS